MVSIIPFVLFGREQHQSRVGWCGYIRTWGMPSCVFNAQGCAVGHVGEKGPEEPLNGHQQRGAPKDDVDPPLQGCEMVLADPVIPLCEGMCHSCNSPAAAAVARASTFLRSFGEQSF